MGVEEEKMWRRRRKHWLGFSLVELMAVVAVIGILVSLALPRFRVFIARSRQAEAMHNLGNIHTLQKSYNLKYQGFGKDNIWWRGSATSVFGASGGIIMGNGSNDNHCTAAHKNNELGFRAEDCDRLRYTYFVLGNTSAATNDGSGSNFIYPNCDGSMDQWGICFTDPSTCIGDVGTLYHAIDIVAACDN